MPTAPIRTFVERHGGLYTPELEPLALGSPHMAGAIMSPACNLPWSAMQTIEAFLVEQVEYAARHPIQLAPGHRHCSPDFRKPALASARTEAARKRQYSIVTWQR